MTFLQACILGAVQGLTEFLPISSSAHLILFPWFLGWEDPGLAFDVFLHLGTLVAVFTYFVKDWIRLFSAGFRSLMERRIGGEWDRRVFWLLVVGNLPAVIAGVLLHEPIQSIFRSPLLISVTLAVVGLLLYWIDETAPKIHSLKDIKLSDAIWIGIAQACALIPGTSRSGATMTMGRWLGFRRTDAARFSFLLAGPIIFGASVYEAKNFGTELLGTVPVAHLMGGFVCSVVSGLIAIHFLMRLLQTASFKWFGWYRITLAAVIIVWSVFAGN